MQSRMIGNGADGHFPDSSWRALLPVQALLAAVIWAAHFLHSAQFGVYEDDWARVPKTDGLDWHGLWELIRTATVTPELSQGRPLHPSFVYFFSFLGFKCGGLHDAYVIAFVILVVNALLFYSFLRKAFHDEIFALLGALAFCVFPADTTQAFLTHGLGVQPAITMLLIAFHCYLADWRKTSYFFIALVLFNYETPYLVFAAAPLLHTRARWKLRKHCLILAAILAFAVVFRTLTGENRVTHIGAMDMLLGSMNIVVGPLTCMAMYLYRPMEAIYKMTWQNVTIVAVCGLVFLWMIIERILPIRRSQRSPQISESASVPTPQSDARKQLFIGIVMLVLAYPLTMTTIGISIAGRGTRVHTAAILGGSILCAWFCSFLLAKVKNRSGMYITAACIACFFALLVGFGLTVQHDYVLGWNEQREFWTDMVALCPRLGDGDVILVDSSGLRDTRQLLFLRKSFNGIPETRQIKSLDSLYDVLPALYRFPPQWKEPPRAFRLPLDWRDTIFTNNDRLRLLTIEAGYSYDPKSRGPVAASHVIFIDTQNGHLTRWNSLTNPRDRKTLPLQDESGRQESLPRTAFYADVIYSNPTDETINYLADGYPNATNAPK